MWYLVGVVKRADYSNKNWFLLSIILAKSSVTKTKSVTVKKLVNVTIYEFLPHIGLHHTKDDVNEEEEEEEDDNNDKEEDCAATNAAAASTGGSMAAQKQGVAACGRTR